jgi:hypothetical protein
MTVTHIIMTALSAVYSKSPSVVLGNGIVAFLYLESGFYNVAMNPLIYAYTTEILNFAMRAKGLAFFLFVTFVWSIVTNYVHPVALANIGYWYYVFFCFVSLPRPLRLPRPLAPGHQNRIETDPMLRST